MISLILGLVIAASPGPRGEAEWLESIPADVPVVLRVRALDAVAADLRAMLKAMSHDTAIEVDDSIEDALDVLKETFGEASSTVPLLVFGYPPEPDRPESQRWALMVTPAAFETLVRGLSGDPNANTPPGASFKDEDGNDWHTARGPGGWTALSTDPGLLKVAENPGDSSLGRALAVEARLKLMEGDVGIYLNLGAVHRLYGTTLHGTIKEAIVDQVKEDNPPGPGLDQSLNALNRVFVGIEQWLRTADVLVLSFEFEESGLALTGWSQPRGRAGLPPKLFLSKGSSSRASPDDLLGYYFSASRELPKPKGLLGRLAPSAHDKAEAARVMSLQGRQVAGFSLFPIRSIAIADPTDPEAASRASLEEGRTRAPDALLPTTLEPDHLDYRGFHLAHSKTVVTDKLVRGIQQEKNNLPRVPEVFDALLPKRMIDTYSGSDGKLFLSTSRIHEDLAKSEIDALKDGTAKLGDREGWKSLRREFPREMTGLAVLNAQEIVKTSLQGYNVFMETELKPPADMPKERQFAGIGMIASPNGYDFRVVVPSAFVSVLEKGLAPLWAQ